MMLSAEYSQVQEKMSSSVLPQTVLHTPRHALYASYLMEPSWHHPIKQEPEENLTNNDSGISPSHYNSDGSVQNTSPQSHQSDDSGQADHHTNATLGVLARPIMEAPTTPHQAPSPKDRLSPRQSLSPQLQLRLSPQQHAAISFLQSDSSPHSPPNYSPKPTSSSRPSPSATPMAVSSPSCSAQMKLPDDNSRSSNSSAEAEMYYDDPLKGLQMAMQRRGMMGPMTTEQPVNGEKPLQCPLCQYSTTLRSAFNNHLLSEHSEQASCHLCDFTADNNMKLREHLQVEHDTQLPDDDGGWDDDEGVTTPKVNSQGKVKTYRCKQCEFSTVTKLDFWEHTRGHIKPERLLTCPKCPFVTEYKHHLEYHLRNHFGSKPFKCDKCSYSCVNKSMLNSHLKSHSNIYQFRCADCAYATKYCHSLKLHLRKYRHSPAMVLNPDGSPNPLPIVDVYGTRRGPKRIKKSEDLPSTQQSIPPLHTMFPSPYSFLPTQTMSYPYSSLMNAFHRTPLLPFVNQSPVMQEEPVHAQSEPESNMYNAAISTIQQSTMNNNQEGVKEYLTRVITTQQQLIPSTVQPEEEDEEESLRSFTGAPLDLSRPEPEPQEQLTESSSDQTPDQSLTSKNRRKGKAFKLERIAQRLQHSSDEEDSNLSPKELRFGHSPGQSADVAEKESTPEKSSSTVENSVLPLVNFSESIDGDVKSTVPEDRKARWRSAKEVYDCPYCDMLFGDLVMYTMHMGYHGYQNPFTCNICGLQTSDKVQFLLHLFRYAHN